VTADINERDLISIPCRLTLTWKEPAGFYVNRMLLGMRDKEEIWAVKCPSCKRVLFPPEIVCGMCKIRIEDKDENWIKLGNEGTVVNFYTVTGNREVDPSTGWHPNGQTFNPIGLIRPDGGNDWTVLAHILEETDTTKLYPGVRVRAVWKPREERHGLMSDIKFWRIVEGEK
jgi:uncharacterized OB-fold protein